MYLPWLQFQTRQLVVQLERLVLLNPAAGHLDLQFALSLSIIIVSERG